MKETKQQLRELIERFSGPDRSDGMAREMEWVEARFASVDCPRPRSELLNRIKHDMLLRHAALRQRTFILRTALSAAACLILGAGVILFVQSNRTVPPQTLTMWDSMVSDQTVQKAQSELEAISEQLYSQRASLWDGDVEERSILEELEGINFETDTDFWKG